MHLVPRRPEPLWYSSEAGQCESALAPSLASCLRALVGEGHLVRGDKVMFRELRQKVLNVGLNDCEVDGERFADLSGDLRFRETLADQLKNSRSDRIAAEHLSTSGIEDDGSVLVLGRTHFV